MGTRAHFLQWFGSEADDPIHPDPFWGSVVSTLQPIAEVELPIMECHRRLAYTTVSILGIDRFKFWSSKLDNGVVR